MIDPRYFDDTVPKLKLYHSRQSSFGALSNFGQFLRSRKAKSSYCQVKTVKNCITLGFRSE
jgi:hypothetical protein